jgi:hypothetical protein
MIVTVALVTVVQSAVLTPEVAKLGAFVGEWRLQEDPADSPNRTICQWSPNRQSLLCDQVHPGPNGTSVKELNIFTYDRAAKRYVMQGMRPLRTVPFEINGQTWIYPSEHVEGGKTIKTRVLNTWPSPSQMHYTVQSSTDDGAKWTTNTEGTMVRTKEAPPLDASASTSASDSSVRALSAIIGTWLVRGTNLATAYSTAGSMSGTSICQWSPNGAFVVCSQLKPEGEGAVAVYSSSDDGQRYRLNTIVPNRGLVDNMMMTIGDGKWTYLADVKERGALRHFRVTRTFTSSTSIHHTEEMSADGTTWVKTSEGDETKIH